MSLSPRWPYVVFDLDGTLVDTIGLIVDSYQHAFTTVLGAPEDEVVIRSWIGQPLIRAFRERSPEQADELFATYIEWNHANTERLIRRYAGVDLLLADLADAGVRCAAATSKLRGAAEAALRLTGLDAYLSGPQALVTLEDTEEHKPDPAPLLLAVERMGGTSGRGGLRRRRGRRRPGGPARGHGRGRGHVGRRRALRRGRGASPTSSPTPSTTCAPPCSAEVRSGSTYRRGAPRTLPGA